MALISSEILTILYNNFDPAVEAGEDFYVDCTDVRGGTTFVQTLCVELSEAQSDQKRGGGYTHALFAGHIGGGKSSELKHLQREMQEKTPKPGRKRLFPVFVDMRQFLDDLDAAREEILLAIVSELAFVLSRDEGIELKDGYLTKRLNELKDYLVSDVEINEGEITLPNSKVKIQRLQTAPEARLKVRAALRGHTTSILEEINKVFIDARTQLKEKSPKQGGTPYTDFVLIVDGLDRLTGYDGRKGADESQRALFLDDSPILIGLQAHCVFTIGLAAMRASEPQLRDRYVRKPFLLPMIKTEKRGILQSDRVEHPAYEEGHERMREIICKRLPLHVTEAMVFEPAALDFLIKYCGGHTRTLMIYARAATLYGERTLPITRHTAERAVAQNIAFTSPLGGADDWKRLAALELSDTQEWQAHDPENRRLLEQLYVLEYINGGDEDVFNDLTPWYAVHPVVRELRPFKRELQALQALQAAQTPTQT